MTFLKSHDSPRGGGLSQGHGKPEAHSLFPSLFPSLFQKPARFSCSLPAPVVQAEARIHQVLALRFSALPTRIPWWIPWLARRWGPLGFP